MNLPPLGRLTVIGLALAVPTFYYAIRFGSGSLRMLSRKFRRGKPYLKGSASDYFLFALGCSAIALLGTALLVASALQGGFQRARGPREMGKVRVEASQPGRIRLKFEMKEDYPGARSLEADLPGARWSLAGESLRWRVGPHWLGFYPGHRIESALGTSAASGSQDRPADSRASVSGTFALSYLARRHPFWFPIAEVAERRTPWMPAEGKTYRIFAGGAGYVLLEEREDKKQAS
ncbi:MAG TPA: hypothetical protein VGR67_06730 [Candidatus Polarisedimenticolia bacterium]|nr:hypothetical protein [Candidatus Polarisedimenticolia bacterium]